MDEADEDPVAVTIKNGIHSNLRKYAVVEIRSLLECLLEKAGMEGMFQATLGARRRGRNHMRRVHVVKDTGSSVKLKIKPGDNTTCCEVYLIVPSTFSGRSTDFLELLREIAPQMG